MRLSDEQLEALRDDPGMPPNAFADRRLYDRISALATEALERGKERDDMTELQQSTLDHLNEQFRRAVELERQVKALREALERVTGEGKVCGAFDICGPHDCIAPECGPWAANNSSAAAYLIAEQALTASTPQESEQ